MFSLGTAVYTMELKPEVQPVVHAARKVTVALREKVKAELDRMEKLNVISKVDEPTKWVNSMVVVPKPNGAVRICLNPRDLNKAISREHYKMITLEEVTSQLSGGQYFTVLDETSGYWAMPLSKESSILTTFQTPYGRYRYLRMPFAICSAQEVCMYVCKTLFTDASLVNKIVGFHKGRQTIKKKESRKIFTKRQKRKERRKNKYLAYLQKVGVIRLNINNYNKDLFNLTDY